VALKRWTSYLLIIVLLFSILGAAYLAIQRHSLEVDNKAIEIALESNEIERLTRYSELTQKEVLKILKDTGVSGILFKEQVISDLEPHKAWVVSGSQIKLNEIYRKALDDNISEIHSDYNYIITADEIVHNQIKTNLSAKVFGVHVPSSSGELQFVGVPITKAELNTIGLGFDRSMMNNAVLEGFNLLVQIRNWSQSSPDGIRKVFDNLAFYKDNITTVLFNDYIVPGYPDYLHVVNEGINKLEANFAFIETFIFNQVGARQIGLSNPTNVVRLHSIGANEMVNMSPQRAVDRLLLAATDRNVRILLVRMFFPQDTSDWIEINKNFIAGGDGFIGLVPALENEGFSIGGAKPFSLHVTSHEGQKLLVYLIGLGVIGGGILLLRRIELNKLAYILGIIGFLGWTFISLTSILMGLAVKIMALASVIIFPTLSVTIVLQTEPAGSILKSISKLLITSMISLCGALLMVGLFAHLNYMLKLDQFAGVKVAHLMPILLLVFIFYFWKDKKDLPERIKSILDLTVTYKYLLLIGFFLLAALIYIIRTGNEAAAVSSLELQIRTILDNLLYVRPRTKEFLIGHPFMLLLLYLGYNHRYLPLLLLGIIGQISMVNTFAHIHTPLFISLIRTLNGLWVGILCGIVLILLWKVYKFLEGRLFDG
jgi:hypothetical protein